jgi:hypothetical protein
MRSSCGSRQTSGLAEAISLHLGEFAIHAARILASSATQRGF